MSDKVRRFFSADSLERAVLDAASHYGVDPAALAYEPVEKRGLTKRRKVVIRVDPDSPLKAAGEKPESAENGVVEVSPEATSDDGGGGAFALTAPAPEDEGELPPVEAEPLAEAVEEPKAESPEHGEEGSRRGSNAPPAREMEVRLPSNVTEWFDLLPEADVEERVAAERWTTALLELAGLDLTPRVRQGEEQLEISLTGSDAEWLADDDGEILLAMQHLLPRLMQSDLERLVSCRVDCGGFQLLREERLRARAHWAAEEVRSEGRSVTLEPMPPADRRIIHLTLVNDSTVDTESLGRGFFKRVSVRPA